MIIINKLKKAKTYQMPEMPDFKQNKSKTVWLKNQKMNAALVNIKSISIQVRDIKQMIYSEDRRLVNLYTLLVLYDYSNDYDFVTISKYTTGNKPLLYALLNTQWLINIEDIRNKSIEELENECKELEEKIIKLNETDKDNNYIKLLQYKLSCLYEYVSHKDVLESTSKKLSQVKENNQ